MFEKYGAMKQRLHFKSNNTKWTKMEDLEIFSEQARFWAERIFHTIQFFARKYQIALTSFFKNETTDLDKVHKVIDVLDTCERCLDRLRPENFFNGGATSSSGMI